MSSFDCNRVLLTGRLGQNPELKTSAAGAHYVRLSMAVHRGAADGEKKSVTQWHQVVVWGQLAEQCARFLIKGSPLLIEGKLDSHDYTTNGAKKHVVQVVADRVKFLSSRGAQAMSHTESVLDDQAEALVDKSADVVAVTQH